MASLAPHSKPLSPSLSDNTRSTSSSRSKYTSQAGIPHNASQDENSQPSSPIGMTLAEEMARSGEPVQGQGKSCTLGALGEADGVFTIAGLVGEQDITEIEITFDDVHTPPHELGVPTEPLVPTDIVSNQIPVDEPMVVDPETASRPGDHTVEPACVPQDVSDATTQGRPPVKSGHTLRERRMTYLRDMYAMLDQPAPDVPRAILRATSTLRRSKWEIEAGVVGKHRKGGLPVFMAEYRGSPFAFLHIKRQLIIEEIRKKRGDKLGGLLRLKEPEVPQSVGEESSNSVQPDRLEIEEILRNANLAAGDLDEADMEGVVNAVMSAASEAARLATASF